ncbi:MAG: putative zinc-binding protein [Candidatus Izemoplasmatales bacterium]|jgi:uncharacterized metal-binding protein|nr:putative zinc-binding protein [Candidatus Izemoplasmatales bacterium]
MKIGILPCQGTSNTGVMTTKAAMHFVGKDDVGMVCPLGLPLGIEGIIKQALSNDAHIALNGCPIKCASKALQSIGVTDFDEMTLTSDFNIQKNKDFSDETGLFEVIEALGKTISNIQANQH